MKILKKTFLDNQKITWVEEGNSVPFMQGEALNKLNAEYPTNKIRKSGWFVFGDRHEDEDNPILEHACYYLIERKTNIENKVQECLIAFKENGDNIEGCAIFTN